MKHNWIIRRVEAHQESQVVPVYEDGEEVGTRTVPGDDCSYWLAYHPPTRRRVHALTKRRLREILR